MPRSNRPKSLPKSAPGSSDLPADGPACSGGTKPDLDAKSQATDGKHADCERDDLKRNVLPHAQVSAGRPANRYPGMLPAIEAFIEYARESAIQEERRAEAAARRKLAEFELAQAKRRAAADNHEPAWKRLHLRRGIGGDTAELDGQSYRLTGQADFALLELLQREEGTAIKADTLEGQIGDRPKRVWDRLDPALQAIVERPGRGQVGYRML